MPKRKSRNRPPALGMALLYLREMLGYTKTMLQGLLGIADETLGRYERGELKLSREKIDELIEPLGHPPEAVDVLVFAHEMISPPDEPPSPVALTPGERRRVHRTVLATVWSVGVRLRAELVRQHRDAKIAAARRQAEELWQGLQGLSGKERRELVITYPQYRSWALALRLCDASIRAAAHKPADALELARLALFVAERVREHESFRLRLQGLVHGFVANALRVLEDYDAADAEFARAWQLWKAGEGADPELLPEWRLLDLEASLRRGQRRFDESLDLLDRAYRACPMGEAAGRILLNKSAVLEQMGDPKGSLAALEEAAPRLERTRDLRLLRVLRFNTAACLVHLQRYQEARRLLSKVRDVAVQMASEVDLTRLRWLAARVDAGQGRSDDAIAALVQVQAAFTARELPYDAALSSLDLAVLWLERGRTAEVARLAAGMAWIFNAKGIHQEALASLWLFHEAARREAATVELTRRVLAEVEKVMRTAPPLREERGYEI